MSQTMRACVLHGARDLRLESRSLPSLAPGMVLLRVRRAGICGSDLHYFEHGYCGAFVPSRPFVLGHELVGTVEAVSDGAGGLSRGTRVAVNPARHCGVCDYCRAGRGNLCRSTIMLGSASTSPPTDGAFADYVAVHAVQCHPLPPDLEDGVGAMLEPFAVALHALSRAGSVSGQKVLVTGGGAIGLLVALTARAFGAAPVVLSDPIGERRAMASSLGIDAALDPASRDFDERAKELSGDGFDVAFEASGAAIALRRSFGMVRAGGTIVQIGTLPTDDIPLPANQLMVREIQFLGSFRYGNVFGEGIRLLASRRIDPQVLIGGVWPLSRIGEAMRSASGRSGAVKVQIDFGSEDRL
jgi:L-idonate 5-dehydrogenase